MPGSSRHDPTRHRLKFDDWPELDRRLWMASLRQGGLFDNDGAAAHLSPATVEKHCQSYGRWLGWLKRQGLLDPDLPPGQRVTSERVHRYAEDLKAQVAPYTVLLLLADLLSVLNVSSPNEDWSWLRRVVAKLKGARPNGRDKRPRLRSSRSMFVIALKELRLIDAKADLDVTPALRYRDVLIVAFLAARPLRRRNMVSIRIGTHLVPSGDGYRLVFEPQEMKNRRAFEIGVTDRLVLFLNRYISIWRPLLLKGSDTDRLWVNRNGQPMSYMGFYQRILVTTESLFGVAINPHLFRDAMATTVAIEDPEHVRIVMALNSHSSLATDERHYIQAGSLDAGRHYHAVIRARRREASRTGR